jgi:hypothetical protein
MDPADLWRRLSDTDLPKLRSPDLVPVVFAGEGKRNEPEKYLQNGRQLG